MVRHKLAIVIPALNEANSIGEIVLKSKMYGIPIVIDDGSTDGTSEVAESTGAVVVRHKKNYGYDKSLNSGFQRADELGVEFVITIDADGQHNPLLIPRCLDLLVNGADIVVGIRDKQQRIAEVCFGYLTKRIYGLYDPLCGFKGYKICLYHSLGYFDSYNSIGTELALYALQQGHRLSQIPILVFDRQDKPRIGGRFSANKKIFRAIFIFILRIKINFKIFL